MPPDPRREKEDRDRFSQFWRRPVQVLFGRCSELKEVTQLLRQMDNKLEKIMATQAEFEAAFGRIDTATSAIAALIRKYVEDAQKGNMTEAEEAAALARLTGSASALEAMAVIPTDPVPVPVPA